MGKSVVVVPLHSQILRDGPSAIDLERHIVQRYRREGCDGIFLSDITYLGVRMPVSQVLRSLVPDRCFCVVDGAQAINHRPINLTRLGCDLYLAGTQKWLRSYHPLRIALVGRERNARSIANMTRSNRHRFDPLFQFCEAMDGNDFESFGETVNVSALITATGALDEAMTHRVPLNHLWQVVANNTRTLANWFEGNAWNPISCGDLQSGILLLQHRKPISGDHTRLRFGMAQSGIVASAFPGSLVRLSMPRFTLPLKHMTLLLKGLSSLSS
jgi:aspartate aminotransferase-like enzyme